jgi:branched-chain amino acid transport system permease protein
MGVRSGLARWLSLALLLAGAALPLGFEQYKLYVATLVLVYLIMAIGLNLTLGYAGQISLAHAAFMSVGAYAVAILGPLGVPFEVGLVVGAVLSFVLGVVVGFPALRVKHHYLAMVTLGFNVIVFLTLRNWQSFTGGALGISDIARPAWGALSFRSDLGFYVYVLAWTGLVVASAWWLLHSRWGRAFRAIRENEMRAEVVGVNLRTYKLLAFAIGAGYAGIGGALFAPLVGYIDPTAFTIDRSIQFLMMVVIGGMGRFEGPFIGALVVTALPEVLRGAEGVYLIIFSSAVILMVLFLPGGLVGAWDRLRARLDRQAPAELAAAAPGADAEKL